MIEPVVLSIETTVKGLNVEIKIPNMEDIGR